jgi:hypothetical protein
MNAFGSIPQKLTENFRRNKDRILRRKRRVMEFGVRPYLLRSTIKHIHGPAKISYGPDELLLISVVRNGELYVKSYMEHYRALGVRHFVFLDNISTDRTLDMLCAWDGVTVLQTDASYQKYENTMKRYLAERFSSGRWNLCADIDELFDYPFSDRLSLRDFLRYLNNNRYTAVLCQMLDMFSDLPLAALNSTPDDRLKEKYPYYDISAIRKLDYVWSRRSNVELKGHLDGIRKTVFGTANGLSKAAVVLMDGKVKTFITWHHVRGAWLADISCVLLHYPFVSSFAAKVEEAVQTGRYGMTTTDEYQAYAKTLARNPALGLKLNSARLFTGLEQLIEDRFLVVSDKYRQWVADHAPERSLQLN